MKSFADADVGNNLYFIYSWKLSKMLRVRGRKYLTEQFIDNKLSQLFSQASIKIERMYFLTYMLWQKLFTSLFIQYDQFAEIPQDLQNKLFVNFHQ